MRNRDFHTLPDLNEGGVLSALGERDACQEEKDEESRELQGLLAGKSETDVKSNTQARWQDCAQAAWSRNTGHISVGNKNVSVINDPLGTHGPY